MDPASIAFGAASVVGLFDTGMTIFGYIEKGRSFGADFRTSEVKLRVAGLRFARWGKAIGLADNADDASLMRRMDLADTDLLGPKMLLGLIRKSMEDAHEVSKRYGMEEAQHTVEETNVTSLTRIDQLGALTRRLSVDRQKTAPLKKKTNWALKGEQELNRLLDSVTSLIGSLEALFPAAEQTRQSLADREAHELSQVAEHLLVFMKEVAAGRKSDDLVLEKALRKKTQADANHQTTNNWGAHNSGSQIGSMSGGTVNNGPR
ncbi:hypothetical protein LTR85_001705 [Meristemomyces frigidus]|nr:hypothetical protein LTR85_001705 [Meristemomyces frigidus]